MTRNQKEIIRALKEFAKSVLDNPGSIEMRERAEEVLAVVYALETYSDKEDKSDFLGGV